jgi:group I intron endonuclease
MFIYQITNLINSKTYIGKTERTLEQRFKEHSRFKRIGVMPICDAIKKYGKNNFIINSLYETQNVEQLNLLEKELIEQLQPEYNVAPGGNGGALFKDKKHKDSSKEKMRIARVGTKRPGVGGVKKGTKQSTLSINKRVEKQSKEYVFSYLNANVIKIKNLNKFCRENNLSAGAMRGVYFGTKKSYKEYRRIL